MADESKNVAADDALSQAAADAVKGDEPKEEIKAEPEDVIEAKPEDVPHETKEETDDLPAEQKERSQLGRTIAALHRRLDESDQRDVERGDQIDRLVDALQSNQATEELDEDMPVTRSELKSIVRAENKFEREAEKTEETKSSKKYHSDYSTTWAELSKGLSADDYESVITEAEKMNYDPSKDASTDAKLNFKECQLRILKKQVAGKKANPLDKNKPRDDLGTVTTQKVPDRETALPKLDGPAQSYLNYVSNEDGVEAANKLHKSMN